MVRVIGYETIDHILGNISILIGNMLIWQYGSSVNYFVNYLFPFRLLLVLTLCLNFCKLVETL